MRAGPDSATLALARTPASFAFSALKPACGGLKLSIVASMSRRRDLAQHVARLDAAIAVIDFRRHPSRRDAADREVARVIEHGIGQAQVALGQRVGAGEGAELRHRIIGAVERVGAGVLEPRDHGLGAVGEAAVLDPQRRVVARSCRSSPRRRARAAARSTFSNCLPVAMARSRSVICVSLAANSRSIALLISVPMLGSAACGAGAGEGACAIGVGATGGGVCATGGGVYCGCCTTGAGAGTGGASKRGSSARGAGVGIWAGGWVRVVLRGA